MPILDTLNPATLLSGRFRPSQIPSLRGRTAIVTGGSAGIGYHASLALARAGAKVLILGSTPEHGEKAEKEIGEEAAKGGGSVKFYACDFSDLKQVDGVARKLADEDRLDILINNAGLGQAPYEMTNDGLEKHFEVNNLAPWLLTLRLLPLMRKTAEKAPAASVRICMQSSELHRMAPSNTAFASKEEINEERDGIILYGRTKLGLALLARQLVKRNLLGDNKILVTSVHPGTVDTDMQEAWTQSYGMLGSVANAAARTLGKSAEEGAEACLWATTTTDIKAANFNEFQGNYYQDAYGKPGTESAQAQDEALGDRFWEFCQSLTEKIVGEKLG